MTTTKAKLRPPIRESEARKTCHRQNRNDDCHPYSYEHRFFPRTSEDGFRNTQPPSEPDRTSSVRYFSRTESAEIRYLLKLGQAVETDIRNLRQKLERLETGTRDRQPGVSRFRAQETCTPSLNAFVEKLTRKMESNRQFKTALSFRYAVKNFLKFTGKIDVSLTEIDSDLACAYEQWMKARNVTPNTSSYYMRILRSIYNKAAGKGLTPQRYPFQHVYTGVAKTPKRAVDRTTVVRLKTLRLNPGSALAFARDLFLFSLYTRGMSFVDIAYLRTDNVYGSFIRYHRHKTGQFLSIKLEACMKEIIDRYAPFTRSSGYLFPILKTTEPMRAFKQYRNALTYHNKLLKDLAKMAGISLGLTSYVARHTWATLAHKSAIPVSVISESMGHYSEKTTRIYLASLDQSSIDEANSVVLSKL